MWAIPRRAAIRERCAATWCSRPRRGRFPRCWRSTRTEGYPGNDDGRELQAKLDQAKLRIDMTNSARWLKGHALSSGRLGAVGFCWGGGMVNQLAVALDAALPRGCGAARLVADRRLLQAEPFLIRFFGWRY